MTASSQAQKRLEKSKTRSSKLDARGSKKNVQIAGVVAGKASSLKKGGGSKRNMFQSMKVMPGGRSSIKIPGAVLKVGDPAWVRDEDKSSHDVYVKAVITSITDAGDKISLTGPDGGSLTKATSEVIPANTSEDTPGDHTGLIHLNEPSILHNTKMRFAKDEIYTFTGCAPAPAPGAWVGMWAGPCACGAGARGARGRSGR